MFSQTFFSISEPQILAESRCRFIALLLGGDLVLLKQSLGHVWFARAALVLPQSVVHSYGNVRDLLVLAILTQVLLHGRNIHGLSASFNSSALLPEIHRWLGRFRVDFISEWTFGLRLVLLEDLARTARVLFEQRIGLLHLDLLVGRSPTNLITKCAVAAENVFRW